MRWQERGDAKGDTEIAVPSMLFPDGVEVHLDGSKVNRPDWDRDTGVLRLTADPKAKSHEVCIAANGSTACT